MIRPGLRYLILFLSLGLVASYASGMILTVYSFLPSGTLEWGYGFPLAWQIRTATPCGSFEPLDVYPILNAQCLNPCCDTNYTNWIYFTLDVLFYMGIGYLLLLSYHKLIRGIDRQARERVNSQPSEPEASVEPVKSHSKYFLRVRIVR
ncbi:hypothetical protein E6H32_01735 [Candidatus Bathyarchaeota archaeon]|nr:MAG: hypothetical protein E6H32_01735 [Candidatus Bathyarchaeota archaeon]